MARTKLRILLAALRLGLPLALSLIEGSFATVWAYAEEKPADKKEVVTSSGLRYIDLKVGEGDETKPGDVVTINFTGWLTDGTKFDSSLDKKKPLTFKLGAGQVLEGWDQGIPGMRVGGKRKLTIPPALGYGNQAVGTIVPPKSTLVYEIELLGIKK